MKPAKAILVLALLCVAAIPAWCGRGFRGGFSPGSGSHRKLTQSRKTQHKPAKPAKASARAKKTFHHS